MAYRTGRRLRWKVAVARFNVTSPDDLVPCHWCRRLAPWPTLTNEHLLRREDGGGSRLQNVVLAHAYCNAAREQHLRSCDVCGSWQPCLMAMVYGERCVHRHSPPRCLLGKTAAMKLRMSKLRTFSLRTMIRSGRGDFWDRHDVHDMNYRTLGRRRPFTIDVSGFEPAAARKNNSGVLSAS